MKVLKFGGTSVGSAERIKNVAKLIVEDGQPKFVVLSAMSGTTNTLLEISGYYRLQNAVGASEVIVRLEQKYKEVIEALYTNDDLKKEAKRVMKGIFEYIRSFANRPFTIYEEKCIVAQGELMSTNLMNLYLKQEGVKVGFMGFTKWQYSAKDIYRAVKAQRKKCDLMIVSIHWGSQCLW